MSIGSEPRIEGYVVIAPLATGGMGELWLARDVKLERMVALKLLRTDVTQDSSRVSRFRQEARAASALNHPNVCTIHALGETSDGAQFIAMEHIEGETLRQRLAREPLPVQDAASTALQIASALKTAHAAGVVHRDLKPENVMVRPDGLVKVVDFGVAKLMPSPVIASDETRSVARTREGLVVGTVDYMSPEQIRGQEVDARTDIWSLGVVLYEMIAGRNPFGGQTSSDVIAAILERRPTPIEHHHPASPPELQRILNKTLQKDREQRYQTATDLMLDLQPLGAASSADSDAGPGEPTPFTAPTGSRGDTDRPSLPSATRPAATIGARKLTRTLAALTVVALIAAWWWMLSRQSALSIDESSVAVLPFRTIGAGDGYFADGITEAITTEIGKVRGLRVIASNTSFRYRDATNLRQLGRELGVGLIVRGAVQRAGETVRIDVSLVSTRDETSLWSERYNRQLTHVLAVQDDISQQIAETLSKTVATAAGETPPSPPDTVPGAYDAYLLGVWHLKGQAAAGAEAGPVRRATAIEHLQRAVSLDKDFALARAALASAYTQRFFYDAPDPALEQQAYLELTHALDRNPNLAQAYLARAQLSWTLRNGFPHKQAITDLQTALSINPNLAEAYVELGKVYYHIGLTERAIDANDRAQRLDPSEPASRRRRFLALLDAGQLDRVMEEIDRDPAELGTYPRADALIVLGQFDQALQVLSHAERSDSSNATPESGPQFDGLRAVAYARLDRRKEAEQMLVAAMPAAENPSGLSHMHHAQFHIGSALAWLGRHEEAVDWLTKASEQGYSSFPRLSTDPTFKALRGYAGFEKLLAKLRTEHERWLRQQY